MDAFSYLSVLLSIILGLAITQILKGVRGWALSRARVVVYWPTLVLAVRACAGMVNARAVTPAVAVPKRIAVSTARRLRTVITRPFSQSS